MGTIHLEKGTGELTLKLVYSIPYHGYNLETWTIRSTVNVTEQSLLAILGYNDKISGRGVGWIRATSDFFYGIWENDFEGDIS
jgi:hypothetical protein